MSEDVSQEVEALFQQMFAAGELEREDWYDFGGKLHQIGRPALSRALELARDPNPEVRERSAFVLGQLTDHEVSRQSKVQDGIPTLLSLLEHDPELEVKTSCVIGWVSLVNRVRVGFRKAYSPLE